ncbi:MAG: 4Fe-4S dicluster domain-containing protein [Deltaproteobacteria bacterium]|nr:4Fe-4S dicluster domain-containing protein [Deltaproteobacteria bacterium]
MELSRRKILKLFGISALALSTSPVLDAFAAEQAGHGAAAEPYVKRDDKALKARKWAMVIDTYKFKSEADFAPLIGACHRIHNVPSLPIKRHEIMWIWTAPYHNAFPSSPMKFVNERLEHAPLLVLCNHCENPPCVRACPTNATFKSPDNGIVMMDFHRCIGCRFCMAACPYGARSFNYRDPRPFIAETNKLFPTRMKGVVEKCNFCAERLAEGQLPACVEASDGKLVFGDLYDPESKVRELLRTNYTIRRKQALGTEPAVYYIV